MRSAKIGPLALGVAWALAGPVCWAQLEPAGQDALTPGVPPPLPWERVLERLRGERDRLSADLEAAHAALLPRAKSAAPSLVDRLSLEPPKPRPWGYGYLPEIRPSPEERKTVLRRKAFSLEWLDDAFTRAGREAEMLLGKAGNDPGAPLEPMCAEFERLRARLRLLESNLSYHSHWQQAILDYPAYFARKNEIVARVRAWRDLVQSGADPDREQVLARAVGEQVSVFRPTRGLRVERRNGGCTLPVRVVTDIHDQAFLEELRIAVREAYVDSRAARNRSFRIELTIEQLPLEELFPGGVPERGARIAAKDHVGRFPKGALVLTTGARSTHAFVGRYVRLGPHPRSRRSLAHEFSHLLGFSDAYLRGYEGSPSDPFGCVVVEWSGLVDDLMGSPGRGRVTEAMIDQLIAAYSEP